MKELFPSLLACVSFLLSVFTLWITQFRRGRVKMTQPTLLCLKREPPQGTPKIFLRTLLYATASKGRVVESMFLRVHQNGISHKLDFWGHTDGGKLTLGSGLFVGPTGVVCDHHFNPRRDSRDFLFVDGHYRVEVFAAVIGWRKPRKLMEVSFDLSSQQAAELIQIIDLELFLFWDGDVGGYVGHLERSPQRSI